MRKAFVTFSNNFDRVTPLSSRYKRKKKSSPFVVVNTDEDNGIYVRRIIKEAKLLGLMEAPKLFRGKSVRSIRTGDFIIFGDAPKRYSYDYRVETDVEVVEEFDARVCKVFDAIDDFHKILEKIRDYAVANSLLRLSYEENFYYPPKYYKPKRTYRRRYYKEPKFLKKDFADAIGEIDIEIEIPKQQRHKNLVVKKSDFNDTRFYTCDPTISVDKVTVHHNWVKIGMDQYDINLDLKLGREFIEVEGTTFFVEEDRFGNRFLTRY